MKRSNLLVNISFLVTGLFATLLAFLVSSSFMGKTRAQQAEAPVVAPVGGAPEVLDAAVIQQITEDPGILLKSLRTYDYDPKNKRDPFQPYYGQLELLPGKSVGPLMFLQRYELDQLELVGIIWDVSRPKAMIKDPNGTLHVVEQNSKVGRNNGYIAIIREGEIVVVEPIEDEGKTTYTTRVVSIGRKE
ncbi:MAG: pilus assembly protein PilP [Pseudomonadota bacterium]|nr:pilus assembly protein PilP [Pseudomonadota bacterium]